MAFLTDGRNLSLRCARHVRFVYSAINKSTSSFSLVEMSSALNDGFEFRAIGLELGLVVSVIFLESSSFSK